MLLVLFLGAAIAMLVYRLTRRKVTQQTDEAILRLFFRKMLFPLGLAIISLLIEYLLKDQINITGQLLTIILFADEIVFFVATAWIINLIDNAIAEWIISKPSIQDNSSMQI